MTSATSATSLPEMPNVQHRTEHHRLDEQQVDEHGVNIVNYGDWAHEQGLNPPQREDPLSTMVARASEESRSDDDENVNDTEMGLFNGTCAVHPLLGVVSVDQGILQDPYLAAFVRTPGIGGMRHGVTVRARGTPAELLNNSIYQGMKETVEKKQEQAQFEWEQLDRRKEEIAEEQGKLDAERKQMTAEMNRKIATAEAREKE